VQKRGFSESEVDAAVEKSLRKFFGKRGEKIVQENLMAVRRGRSEVVEIPWDVMLRRLRGVPSSIVKAVEILSAEA
jgi:hypothetical protein